MNNTIEVDVRDFYQTLRHCLEEVADTACDQIEGLSRSAAALRRLILQGQETVIVETGCWERIADIVEAEADRIDSFRNSRRRCVDTEPLHTGM